ncbi:MAG: hypothetical protein ACNA8O_08270 [Cyanobacteriota bacterium]
MGLIVFLLLIIGFIFLIRAGQKKTKSPSVSTSKTTSGVRPIPPPPPPPPPLPSTIQPTTPDEDREPFSFEKAGLLPERIRPADYAEGQDSDAWESLYGFAPERRLEIELEIDYRDRNGQDTTRRIRLKRFACNDSLSDAALMAHCYLRGGFRSFRASRVQRCVDVETGEIIRNLPQHLLDTYASSPAGLLEAMWEKYGDELAALVYVGKLDGRLMKKEKEVIVSYMLNRFGDGNLGEADLLEELKAVDVLSKNQFARCLGRLAALNDLDRSAFVEAVEAILATKKAKSAAEEEVIPYVRKRLGMSR